MFKVTFWKYKLWMNLFADHDVKYVFDNKINDEFDGDFIKSGSKKKFGGVFLPIKT